MNTDLIGGSFEPPSTAVYVSGIVLLALLLALLLRRFQYLTKLLHPLHSHLRQSLT